MAVSQRSGSLPYTVLVSAIVFFSFGLIWLLLEQQFVYQIQTVDVWSEGSVAASVARSYIEQAWNWLPLVVITRIGLGFLISARTQNSGASLAGGTVVILITHLFMLIWALVFPTTLDPLFDMALASEQVAAAGFDSGVQLLYDGAFRLGPGGLLLVVDLWYLSSPIRRDAFAGYR